jgi:hypothetical protein
MMNLHTEGNEEMHQGMLSLSEIRYKEAEERFYDMQYKISYLVWKVKPAWPVVDIVALFFNFGVAMAIVALALYF